MALAWRTAATVGPGLGTAIVVSLTGFSIGDLMVACVSSQSGASNCTPPAGWNEIHDAVGSSGFGASYYRVKDGTDGATATFTLGADTYRVLAATAAYDTGAITVSAVTTTATATDTGGTGISLPAIPAPGATGYLGVAFACGRGQNAIAQQVTTNPTGWTKVAERTNPATGNGLVHAAIFAKENISSSGETPTGGVWNDANYESNAVKGFLLTVAGAAPAFVPQIIIS